MMLQNGLKRFGSSWLGNGWETKWLGNSFSDKALINCAVSQGTILETLLFLLYVNPIVQAVICDLLL